MAAHRIGDPVGTADPAGSAPPEDHPWRVVLLVLVGLVVVLGLIAIGVVAASSGMITDIWNAMTSVFHQP
jgi:hypothetical protein